MRHSDLCLFTLNAPAEIYANIVSEFPTICEMKSFLLNYKATLDQQYKLLDCIERLRCIFTYFQGQYAQDYEYCCHVEDEL
jgi:hypothetical protein